MATSPIDRQDTVERQETIERRETAENDEIDPFAKPPVGASVVNNQWAPISGPTTLAPSFNQMASRRVSVDTSNSQGITLSISPEQYERLFLQPTPAIGDLSKRFGNPTLLGLLGFVVPFQATMFCLLNWRGSSADSIPALAGSYFFFGGVVMILAGIGEFILGNTFPFVLFISFGAHFCQTAYGVIPGQFVTSVYGPNGQTSAEYNAGTGFYYVQMVLWSCCCLIAVLRINACFLLAFVSVIPCFGFIAASYFQIARNPTPGGLEYANYLLKVAGGFGVFSSLFVWYMILIMACASTGIPCPLPIFDLSHVVFANTKAAADERAGAGGGSVARRLRRSISASFSKDKP